MILLAIKTATVVVAAYTGAAETVAVFSVVEIGPNLLAAITSIIGAVVLIVQLRLARGIKTTKEVVKEHHEELKEAVTTADTAKTYAEENRGRIEDLENGDK